MEGEGGRRLPRWPRRDRSRISADVDTEIAFHLAMRVEELMSRGWSEEAARREAEREFGDIGGTRAELIASDARAERRRSGADAVIDAARDVRIAARGLARAPLFTFVVIATLGLGIGANTALFSVVDGVVLKPLPYRDPEALVAVSPEQAFLNAEYVLVREAARSYEDLAGYRPGVGFSVSGVAEPVRVTGARVTANLLEALGVHAAHGRAFVSADEQHGAEPVVVLSHGLWQELFGAARTALGGKLLIDGTLVALTGQLPFDGELAQTAAAVEHVTLDPNDLPVFDFRPVSPDYFAVLELPLIEGRAFSTADREGALPVAIVDATAAQRFWPGQSALGKRIGRPWLREWLTVVGVVGSVRNNDLLAEPLPALYVPFAQQPPAEATLVLRTARSRTDVAAVIRSAVRETDASIPVEPARPLADLVRDSIASSRSLALLLGTFAAIALALGALGIYGVLAYSVQQRARELGVRLALGATAAEVRTLVLRDGALLLGLGLASGLPLALAVGGALRGLLYDVRATDPASLLTIPLVLGGTGLVAAFLPALRASRVDPAHTLRGD